MNKHLILSLILLNISTHLTAMEELNSDIFPEEKMDWSEWLVEHQTPIIAGSMIGLGAAASAYKWDKKYLIGACELSGCLALYNAIEESEHKNELFIMALGAASSLYKWDKRPIIISSAITSGLLIYKWSKDQKTNHDTDEAIKKKYGIIDPKIQSISHGFDEIKRNISNSNTVRSESIIIDQKNDRELEEIEKQTESIALNQSKMQHLLEGSISLNLMTNSLLNSADAKIDQIRAIENQSFKEITDLNQKNFEEIRNAIQALTPQQ